MSFQIGDTVQLKSGSPLMTVTNQGTQGGKAVIFCAWFEKSDKHEAAFPPEALVAAKKPDYGAVVRGMRSRR